MTSIQLVKKYFSPAVDKYFLQNMKWKDVPEEYISYCVKKIIDDDLELNKNTLKNMLKENYGIVIIEEEENDRQRSIRQNRKIC